MPLRARDNRNTHDEFALLDHILELGIGEPELVSLIQKLDGADGARAKFIGTKGLKRQVEACAKQMYLPLDAGSPRRFHHGIDVLKSGSFEPLQGCTAHRAHHTSPLKFFHESVVRFDPEIFVVLGLDLPVVGRKRLPSARKAKTIARDPRLIDGIFGDSIHAAIAVSISIIRRRERNRQAVYRGHVIQSWALQRHEYDEIARKKTHIGHILRDKTKT